MWYGGVGLGRVQGAPLEPPAALSTAPHVAMQAGPRVKAYKNLPECWIRNFIKGFALGASGRCGAAAASLPWTRVVFATGGAQRSAPRRNTTALQPLLLRNAAW